MPDLIPARTFRYLEVSPADAVDTYKDWAMPARTRARKHVEIFTFKMAITESILKNKKILSKCGQFCSFQPTDWVMRCYDYTPLNKL